MWRGSSRKSRPRLESGRDITTERCCELDRVRARERRYYQTMPWILWCRANESYRKELKYQKDYRTSRVEMGSRARSHTIFSGDNKRNQTCFLCLEEKNTAGKCGWFVDLSKTLVQVTESSQLSLEASANRIQTDGELPNIIAVSDSNT